MSRDRKHPPAAPRGPAPPETPVQRQARKRRESRHQDETLEDTFPAGDPVSSFVPAKRPG